MNQLQMNDLTPAPSLQEPINSGSPELPVYPRLVSNLGFS